MTKLATAISTPLSLLLASATMSNPAQAQWGGWNWGWRGGDWGWGGPALATGLGLVMTAPYYGNGYGYNPYGYYATYATDVPAYGYGSCYITRVWGPYGPQLARVCY